jgi:hypothetical protein
MPEQTPAAAGQPLASGGPGAQQGAQPPFGSSGATQPTANKGFEAAGLQRLGMAVKQLEQLIPMLGSGSEIGKDVLKALNMLVKHVPAGGASPAAEKNNIEQMAMQNAQRAQQAQQMRQSQAGQMQQKAAA